jgi:hypothetical protein
MLWWIVGIIVGIGVVHRLVAMIFFIIVAIKLTIFYFSPYSTLRRFAVSPIILRNYVLEKHKYSEEINQNMLLLSKGYYLYFLLIYSGYPKAFDKNYFSLKKCSI